MALMVSPSTTLVIVLIDDTDRHGNSIHVGLAPHYLNSAENDDKIIKKKRNSGMK